MQTISVVTKRCGSYWACSVSRAAPTSLGCSAKGRSRRLGVQQQAPSARSGLPGFCTQSSPGGGVGASAGRRSQPGQSCFFSISCVVCLKILQHSFAAFSLRLKLMPLKQATKGSRPSDAAKIHRPHRSVDLSELDLQNKSVTASPLTISAPCDGTKPI